MTCNCKQILRQSINKYCSCGGDGPLDCCEVNRLHAEIERLRARTHEIQERCDAIEQQGADDRFRLELWEQEIKRGQDYYWDEAKLARRPYNLSLYDAARFGLLVEEIERLKKELADETTDCEK